MSSRRNAEYWRKRFLAVEELVNKDEEKAVRFINREFAKSESEIRDKINAWYQRFADNNGITMAQAQKALKTGELAELKWTLDEYIKYAKESAVNGLWVRELENASAKAHITRFEALELEIRQTLEKLYQNHHKKTSETLGQTYSDTYYHTIYELDNQASFTKVDRLKLDKVLKKPWTADGRTFSDRIWSDKQKLLSVIHTDLTQSAILGKSPDKTIKAVSQKMGVSRKQAGRLVMTESAAMSTLAQRDAFEELDVDEFEIIETLDGITCDICGGMDGKHFQLPSLEVGTNAPPFHPWCRGCICPYFDDDKGERAARDENGDTHYVNSNMSYTEWREKFVAESEKMRYNKFKNGVQDRIHKGEFPLTINESHQNKHIEGAVGFDPQRSTLTVNPKELITKYAGNGDPIETSSGRWNQRERFTHIYEIGIWRNKITGEELPTNVGIIHYTKKRGLHIVPANPKQRRK